jgi:hypothetical protein
MPIYNADLKTDAEWAIVENRDATPERALEIAARPPIPTPSIFNVTTPA